MPDPLIETSASMAESVEIKTGKVLRRSHDPQTMQRILEQKFK